MLNWFSRPRIVAALCVCSLVFNCAWFVHSALILRHDPCAHTYTEMSGSGSNTLQLDDFDEDNIRIGVVRETMNSNPLLVKVRGVCLPTRLLYFLSSFLPSWLRCQRVLYHLHIQAPLGKPKLNTRNPNQVYGVKSKKVSCAPSMQLFLVFVCASFSSD